MHHRSRGRRMALGSGQRGFTLVELVVTIAVGSVVVAFMALFIVRPLLAYSAQTRRATLVDETDSALRFMGRDLKSALPNSVRTATSGSVTVLEFLATMDAARYVDGGPLANPALALDFTTADGAFATTVPFTQLGPLTVPWTAPTPTYLVIDHVGVTGANAYDMANVITKPTTLTVSAGASANQNLVTFSPAFQFTQGSPGKRVYLVSGPVSYLCDTSANTLTRYSGYTISSSQATTATALNAAGATAALVAGDVGACAFTYATGTANRNALAELTLQLTNSGESVQLLYEVQLVNTP